MGVIALASPVAGVVLDVLVAGVEALSVPWSRDFLHLAMKEKLF